MRRSLQVPALPRKLLTLAFIVRDDMGSQQVLLGMKKRGFGMGKWNGFGGKVEVSDASIAAAAAREIEEEANVSVKAEHLQPRGVLLFSFEEAKEVMEVHVFLTQQFSGEPSESDEMKPQWYDITDIPFKSMWADDHFWLPHVLSGKSVQGHFHFAADEDTLLDHNLER
ncbi:hypothetical protein F442_07367 [Phytophthora nicotianae P10297]|uniref:Oxidized purine nucleoside triphosphate hydrolase n=5 Tax=Phytophthora nicotianae TaxID=4792 RepID=W2QEW4_PHYN3|nr:hypothetical protein PPTG_09869 [Phytophthora nicotianae INRA-310]ETI48688.1 hypothetical protein F443_07307 [Phytophthora nicotianae P1569]ETL41998.1 hypothetical protein L916_07118 [Phytophthora nicotianae]ETO77435.1 hypothetical protein F444_07370 [Phytophthora nicotianae P1976]ETP46381.1 hypothetical protein F442_07367 [Phytophthora nicotianae P10297]ETL95145.1 hypothetical protein L917_07007 [Phytophthora nicotianae]